MILVRENSEVVIIYPDYCMFHSWLTFEWWIYQSKFFFPVLNHVKHETCQLKFAILMFCSLNNPIDAVPEREGWDTTPWSGVPLQKWIDIDHDILGRLMQPGLGMRNLIMRCQQVKKEKLGLRPDSPPRFSACHEAEINALSTISTWI